MKKAMFIFATLLILSSCCRQRFLIDDNAKTIPTYTGTSHFIFWGLGQEEKIDPKEVCDSGKISNVETHLSFLNGLLSGITYGIYSPRNYEIFCEK
jgi:hypothetical protein